jgi:sRNA-binding regulator protein Hfq
MLDPKKPIFRRPAKSAETPKSKPTQETLDRIIREHDDEWLHERKGKIVRVKFIDGEQLSGVIGKCRKFSFELNAAEGSLWVQKVAVKYVAEVK